MLKPLFPTVFQGTLPLGVFAFLMFAGLNMVSAQLPRELDCGPLQGKVLALRHTCYEPLVTEKDTFPGVVCSTHGSYALSFGEENLPRRFKSLSNPQIGQYFISRNEAGLPVSWVVRDSLGDTVVKGGGSYRPGGEFSILWELDKEGDTLWYKKRDFNEEGLWVYELEVDNRTRVQNRRRRVYLMGTEEAEEQELDRLGRPLNKAYLKFDKNGRLRERKQLDKRGWMESLISWKYDGRGRLLEERKLDAEEKQQSRVEFRYDGWGNVVEKRVYLTGNVPQKTFIYEYEYDGEGNWEKMNVYRRKKLEEIRLRDFIYR